LQGFSECLQFLLEESPRLEAMAAQKKAAAAAAAARAEQQQRRRLRGTAFADDAQAPAASSGVRDVLCYNRRPLKSAHSNAPFASHAWFPPFSISLGRVSRLSAAVNLCSVTFAFVTTYARDLDGLGFSWRWEAGEHPCAGESFRRRRDSPPFAHRIDCRVGRNCYPRSPSPILQRGAPALLACQEPPYGEQGLYHTAHQRVQGSATGAWCGVGSNGCASEAGRGGSLRLMLPPLFAARTLSSPILTGRGACGVDCGKGGRMGAAY